MDASVAAKIPIGISSCLLGEKVRFDAGHKRNAYVNGVLSDYFEFHPFCPEVAIGLGIPREPIRLVSSAGEIRCVGVKDPKQEFTDSLREAADGQKSWHKDLCGYILKKDSPSCGMERVKVFENDMPTRKGSGIYAKTLMENFPYLPVEEEGRLEDAHLRENFIQRVYVLHRWKLLAENGLSLADIQSFHAKHKYIFMSHDQNGAKALGALVAEGKKNAVDELAHNYLIAMMDLLKVIASRGNHVNTLQHIQGYLKKHLDGDDKLELVDVIRRYGDGLVPLVVPITLLKHYFRKYPVDYIAESYYLNPHPGELMLLNYV